MVGNIRFYDDIIFSVTCFEVERNQQFHQPKDLQVHVPVKLLQGIERFRIKTDDNR